MTPEDRAFHTFSLYKNSFENLVYKGADTMATVAGSELYELSVVKRGKDIFYGINNLEVVHFHYDGITLGKILIGGIICFVQQQGTTAMYKNLKVTWI